jgi:hypothetical protein
MTCLNPAAPLHGSLWMAIMNEPPPTAGGREVH